MRIIIIEDEPLMAEALAEQILKADASVRIEASLPSIQKTIEFLEKNGFPDLFFSDIELADGLSFEIFKRTDSTVPVIFCTAYNHYALEAFRAYGIDYILKPFAFEDIRESLAKYKELFKKKERESIDFDAVLQLIGDRKRRKQNTVLVHRGEKIIPVRSENIALAELREGVVRLHTFDQQSMAVNYTMEKLHGILGSEFYRVNRRFIINRKGIKHVSQYFARKLLIKPAFTFSEQLIVSKAKASDFLRWLESA